MVSNSQAFIYSSMKQLRIIWDRCFHVFGVEVKLRDCDGAATWEYDIHHKQLVETKSLKCLAIEGENLRMQECAPGNAKQQWTFSGWLNS